jgi:hypothetical protein
LIIGDSFFLAQGAQHGFGADRQFVETRANCVENGVGDGRRRLFQTH